MEITVWFLADWIRIGSGLVPGFQKVNQERRDLGTGLLMPLPRKWGVSNLWDELVSENQSRYHWWFAVMKGQLKHMPHELKLSGCCTWHCGNNVRLILLCTLEHYERKWQAQVYYSRLKSVWESESFHDSPRRISFFLIDVKLILLKIKPKL